MATMTFFGLENKGGNKIPNKIGAFEVLRSFTDYEQVGVGVGVGVDVGVGV